MKSICIGDTHSVILHEGGGFLLCLRTNGNVLMFSNDKAYVPPNHDFKYITMEDIPKLLVLM